MSRAIQAIPTASVAKICSGQVILDLSTAVKELVENALDAGAASVEVRLREHGLQLIEVADNGKGVPPEDHAALALKYHTSKISQFQDLESLHTYGFRGEALSSLSALGELAVITRTAELAAATRLEFDRDGRLTGSSPVARAVGTTVAVKDLFGTLPVRRQEFSRNVRREVAKLKLLLQQYAIMSTQAQLFATDQAGKGARTVLVSTSNAGSSMLDRVSAVLGSKVAALLVPVEVKLEQEGVKISGLVSRAGCGVKGEKLRQFCCINGRPVELPRAIKTLNDTYKSLYSSLVGLRPMAFLSFELPPGTFDINVTPDKRSVFMQREVAIVNALGQALQALWEPSRYSFAVNDTQAAFDSQRPVVPQQQAAAAAAATAELESDDNADHDGDKERPAADPGSSMQHRAGAAAAAAAGSSDGNAAAVGGGAAASRSSRAAPPSLASFMIGASAAAAPAAPGQGNQHGQRQHQVGIKTGACGPSSQAAAVATTAAAAAAAAASGGDGCTSVAGAKRLRPLEAALLGRKLPKLRPDFSAASNSAAEASAAEAAEGAPAATDGSLDVGLLDPDACEDEVGTAAAAAAASGEEAEGADAEVEHIGGYQQQQQQRCQTSRPLLPLSSFQLGGSSSSQADGAQQGVRPVGGHSPPESPQVAAAADDPGGDGSSLAGRRGRVSGDQKQKSLAAYGFKVVAQGQQQHQQQQPLSSQDAALGPTDTAYADSQHEEAAAEVVSEAAAAVEADGPVQQRLGRRGQDSPAGSAGCAAAGLLGVIDMAADEDSDSDSDVAADRGCGGDQTGGEGSRAQQQGGGWLMSQQQELQGTGAAGLAAGVEGDGAPDDDDDDVTLVGEQQQQQQHRRTAGCGKGQPLVLDYSMQQLLADADLHLQQLQLQQQQQQQQEGGAGVQNDQHSHLAAASLQGTSNGDAVSNQPSGADAGGVEDAATSELMRVFNKADFAQMQAVGQFNLGFIIAKLRGDLFIVDQHAADEKSTFERLMGSYSVNKQPLLQPRCLNTLTAMDQQTIREHMDVFKRNGFEFVERETRQQQQRQQQARSQPQKLWSKPPRSKAGAAATAAAAAAGQGASPIAGGSAADGHISSGAAAAADDDGDDQPAASPDAGQDGVDDDVCIVGSELLLSAVPVLKRGASGGGALGEEVLLELLDLIAAGEVRPEDIRPRRVRDVLASRACRTSIMIGSPLTRKQQGRILARLAQLDAPFNCPHGRPTMRHLAVLPIDEQGPGQQQPSHPGPT